MAETGSAGVVSDAATGVVAVAPKSSPHAEEKLVGSATAPISAAKKVPCPTVPKQEPSPARMLVKDEDDRKLPPNDDCEEQMNGQQQCTALGSGETKKSRSADVSAGAAEPVTEKKSSK